LKEFEYNSNFGAADIETYSAVGAHGNGLQIPYAAAFQDAKGNYEKFYTQPGENNFEVIVRMIESMLTRRHNGCVFYFHNLARFDSRFILEALGRMQNVKVDLSGRDMNNIFKIRISKKINNRYIHVVFLDSYYQLSFKLETLGKKFNTLVQKQVFPYRYVNKDNLFYIGKLPGIEFFDGKLTIKEHADLSKKL